MSDMKKDTRYIKLLCKTVLEVLSNYIPIKVPRILDKEIRLIVETSYGNSYAWRKNKHHLFVRAYENFQIEISPIDKEQGIFWIGINLTKSDNNGNEYIVSIDLEVINLPYLMFKPIDKKPYSVIINHEVQTPLKLFKGTPEQVNEFNKKLSTIK